MIISFSARKTGNCADIAQHIAGADDRIVHFCELHAYGCANCEYECFDGVCVHREDGIFALYEAMLAAERVILVVPMYGGNPSSLYFAFCERGQDFFHSEEAWNVVLSRLYIIGVYGSEKETPDFIPCLQKWFAETDYTGRVLGLERHAYGQRMRDSLLDQREVCERIERFLQ